MLLTDACCVELVFQLQMPYSVMS